MRYVVSRHQGRQYRGCRKFEEKFDAGKRISQSERREEPGAESPAANDLFLLAKKVLIFFFKKKNNNIGKVPNAP